MKLFQEGVVLMKCLWLDPPWFLYFFPLTLSRNGLELEILSIFRYDTEFGKSALTHPPPPHHPSPPPPPDHSKAVVPVLVLPFVVLWFILRGDLFNVLPCVILFLCFSVLFALRSPRLGKRELILMFFIRLFGFVCFLFLLVSEKGFGL